MGKLVVNPAYQASADRAYWVGGFSPRAKGQRRPKGWGPDFPNQQGQVSDSGLEVVPNDIVAVTRLPDFLGYGTHGQEVTYRAFAVKLADGRTVAGYSHNEDSYVMCHHSGYVF